MDGFNGLAPLALEAGREPLVALAREHGIAALAITNTHHFAALWPETEALAERGLVGFAFVAAMSYVAPAGGTRPLYGTNPMSFAWPRDGGAAAAGLRPGIERERARRDHDPPARRRAAPGRVGDRHRRQSDDGPGGGPCRRAAPLRRLQGGRPSPS